MKNEPEGTGKIGSRDQSLKAVVAIQVKKIKPINMEGQSGWKEALSE